MTPLCATTGMSTTKSITCNSGTSRHCLDHHSCRCNMTGHTGKNKARREITNLHDLHTREADHSMNCMASTIITRNLLAKSIALKSQELFMTPATHNPIKLPPAIRTRESHISAAMAERELLVVQNARKCTRVTMEPV